MNDQELKIKGFELLSQGLGIYEAERFITLLLREPFDYTEWQKNLWKDKSVEDISKAAMENLKRKI